MEDQFTSKLMESRARDFAAYLQNCPQTPPNWVRIVYSVEYDDGCQMEAQVVREGYSAQEKTAPPEREPDGLWKRLRSLAGLARR